MSKLTPAPANLPETFIGLLPDRFKVLHQLALQVPFQACSGKPGGLVMGFVHLF